MKNTIERGGKMAAIADEAIESEYRKIIRSRAPRVIRSQLQHRLYLAMANEIVDKGDGASPAEIEYLALLAVLIAAYERQHFKQKSTPADRLRELLRSHDLKPVALCDVFGSRGTVYEVLSGKRTISKRAAKLLAEMFSVSAEIFI